jgi:VWFA-related protein
MRNIAPLLGLGAALISFSSALRSADAPPLNWNISGMSFHEVLAKNGQADNTSPFMLAVDSTLVRMDVLVTDEDGRVLNGLKPGNFRVFDNGLLQKVTSFEPTTAPITIVMLLEYSAESYNYFAAKASLWGTKFVDHLEARDWVALSTFDLKSTVKVDFTHSRYEVRDALTSLGPPQFREANLFDALIETLDKLDRVRGRKSILLLATGANTFSSATLDEVLQRLRRTDVTIFVVGLAEQEYVRHNGSNISYVQAKSSLSTFAAKTGGLALFPRFEGELPEVFQSVVGSLRSEYTLSFCPPREMHDGKYHRLKVEIVGQGGNPLRVMDEKGHRRKVEVYTREGYVAPKGNIQEGSPVSPKPGGSGDKGKSYE